MSSVESKLGKMSLTGKDGKPLADVTKDKVHKLADTWNEIKPIEYNYKVYNATTREEREIAEAEAKKAADEQAAKDKLEQKADGDGQYTAEVPLWASNAMKYEWDDEYGDVGPAHPELEKQLFHDRFISRAGHKLETYHKIKAVIESEKKVNPIAKFADAGLHPIMLRNIELCGYSSPTPIQAYCLPAILSNHDVIAVAQTGSGKTAAFLIPVLSKLMGKAKKLAAPRPNVTRGYNPDTDGVRAEPLVLVVCPTRELAVQIFDEARRLCYRSMLRPCVAYGGGPSRDQAGELRKGCDILIATPGRLMDYMQRGTLLSLARVRYTIIDEADEMVGSDWTDDMNMILSGGDNNEDADHRFMMFSATFPKDSRKLARALLSNDHIRVRIGRVGSTHLNIKQNIHYVEESMKRDALFDLLMDMPPARTIVFVNGKKSADFLDDYLYNRGLPSTSIHSDRTQREREDALRAFKSGKAPVMVATGVSARGLDIINVMHVVNFDMPSADYGGIQDYIHRIGRTARIGNDGLATSFFNDSNEDIAEALTKVLVESKQVVPPFLEQYRPAEDEELDFGDDTDDEEETSGDVAGGSAWGAAAGDARVASAPEPAAKPAAEPTPEPATDSWVPPPEKEPAAKEEEMTW